MEIASIFGRSIEADLQQQIGSIDCVVAAIDDLHESLARRYGVYILAASSPMLEGGADPAGWTFADIEPGRVREARGNGQVFNHRDWARQPDLNAGSPTVRRQVVR